MLKLTPIIERSEISVNVEERNVSGWLGSLFSVWFYMRDAIRHGVRGKYIH